MKIGIDISALQSAHRMRGIGFTVLNFINHIPIEDRKNNHYIFFVEENKASPLEFLNLKAMQYEVRYILPRKATHHIIDKPTIIARIHKLLLGIGRQARELRDLYFGSSRYHDVEDIDVFIQPDQTQSLPKGRSMKKVLLIYDIIPYVLEWEYLWSYHTARIRGLPRLSAFRCGARRWLYVKKLAVNARRANLLIAISEHTKKDFIRFVGVRPSKIEVIHLGVDYSQKLSDAGSYRRYLPTSWGYSPKPYKLKGDVPFILFVGGADPRRKLDHLVTAFNQLRGEGLELKLVLAGDSMQGPRNISTVAIQKSLHGSSYIDDIVFLGFVPNSVREYLYDKAAAFVYPSTYEGFGLPVLEAMAHGCPVICYPAAAVKEVAQKIPLYVEDAEGIRKAVVKLLGQKKAERRKWEEMAIAHASRFNWDETSKSIINKLAPRPSI